MQGVPVGVGVGVEVTVAVGVGVNVAVAVGVGVKVAVAVAVGATVGVGVNVAVAVGVGVKVAVGVEVAVAVAVGVDVAVEVGVGETAGQAPGWETTTVSILQPCAVADVSLPMRQRNTMFCPAADGGRFTVVVIKPAELPLHAWRPARGLLWVVSIVPT